MNLKEAIKHLETYNEKLVYEITDKDRKAISIVLKELEKKSNIINKMSNYIDISDLDIKCSPLCVHDNCVQECIIKYFENNY